MSTAEGYDVLRLIEHGRSCYISADYVKGRPLIQWLKCHPELSKEQLFSWIHEMSRQLECIHKCRGQPCYQYVNPYSIIITEEKELYFLDMNAESNAKQLLVMRRRSVREYFLPPEEAYYQNAAVELDIYGLGRTIQYLLSATELYEPLGRREELRFQKIISKSLDRHSGRSYHQVSELRRQLPVYQKPKKIIYKKKICILAAAIFTAAAAVNLYGGKEGTEGTAAAGKELIEKGQTEKNRQNAGAGEIQPGMDKKTNEADLLAKELGFLYFLDKKDYEKSKEYFEKVQGEESALGMAELAEYMLAGTVEENEKELRRILENVEKEAPEEERYSYYRCMIEGFRVMNTKEASETVIRLSQRCLEENKEEQKDKLTSYLAAAYEKTGEPEQAAEAYTSLLTSESGEIPREELYKRLTVLWQELGEKEKAGSICRQGIEELKESVELRLLHINIQCADAKLDREICAQTIQEYIREIPEITERQEFRKLAQEYGIIMEGEQVWVGR